MPTVAEQLRTAREAQDLTIEDVANLTKLRTDHVRALESGDYDIFSAPIYVRGFTRTYARLLKLDSKALIAALTRELEGQESGPSEEDGPIPPKKGFVELLALYLSRINWKIALPLMFLCGLIGIGSLGVRLWQHQQTKDPLSDLGEGIYTDEKASPSAYLPLPRNVDLSPTNSPSQ